MNNKEDFYLKLKAKLETLFTQYEKKLQTEVQRKIVQNGFVFSEVDPTAQILVMGINPSLRNDFVNANGYSYDYKHIHNDRYFKKFTKLLTDFEPLGITYCDLFYQRHTEQKTIDHFLQDGIGRSFLKAQLTMTRELIEYINPKLILLFNRKGALFFTTKWLGYDTVPITAAFSNETHHVDSLYQIRTLGNYVYFSTFIGYRTKREALNKITVDLPKIFSFLKF